MKNLDLATVIARDIFRFGDGLNDKVQRIEFKGGTYPGGETNLGGLCELALIARIHKFLVEIGLDELSKMMTDEKEELAGLQSKVRTLEEKRLSLNVIIGERDAELEFSQGRIDNLRADNERLQAENENLSCGHRKLDCDDSYGSCIFCQALAALKEEDDEAERLRADNEELQRIIAGHETTIIEEAIEMEKLRAECGELRKEKQWETERAERFRVAYYELSSGRPVEIRMQGGELDEIVGYGVFHIEQMDDDDWFFNLGGCAFNLHGEKVRLTPRDYNTWSEAKAAISQRKALEQSDD